MYLHVFMTWLVANLLHPVAMFFLFADDASGPVGELVGMGFQLFIYSLLLSLPSLLVSCLFIFFISKLPFDVIAKYLTWLFLAASVPVLNFLFISLLIFQDSSLIKELIFILPSVIAVITSILVRTNYFFKLFHQKTTDQNI